MTFLTRFNGVVRAVSLMVVASLVFTVFGGPASSGATLDDKGSGPAVLNAGSDATLGDTPDHEAQDLDAPEDPNDSEDPETPEVPASPETPDVPGEEELDSGDLDGEENEDGEDPTPEEGLEADEAGSDESLVAVPFPTKPLARGFTRLGGKNRYDTSALVSKRIFPKGTTAPSVFIASGALFPDGISIGALAAAEGGPLLLTNPTSLPSEVRSEIKRLKPERIYIAGGTHAVSAGVEKDLKSLTQEVIRLGGKDRYDTSQIISEQFGEVDTVMLATGTAFPDALVASSVVGKAKGKKAPVLLTPGFKLGAANKKALKELKPTTVHIVGGTWSKQSLDQIKSLTGGAKVSVHSGKDRYATSANLVKHFYGSQFARFIYATGALFPDAMSAGPLAAAVDAPILLTKRSCKPPVIVGVSGKQSQVAIIGGTGAVLQAGTTTQCRTLPPKVYTSGGFYRFGMKWVGQQTNFWCGPASGEMILRRIGPTRSVAGIPLSQAALASDRYMETNKYGRTAFAYSMFAKGMNAWRGKNQYARMKAPNTTQFRDRVAKSFKSTGRPVVVDTQEWAWGPHYNGHPRVSFSHLLPVEGYNQKTDTILMLDSASYYYYGTGAKNQFSHNLASFTKFLQDFGMYY